MYIYFSSFTSRYFKMPPLILTALATICNRLEGCRQAVITVCCTERYERNFTTTQMTALATM